VDLIVMRAADMKRIHPQTDFTRRCSKCGEEVGIYPSGQQTIREHGEKDVAIICNRCVLPQQVAAAQPLPGVRQEVKESIPNPAPFMSIWTVYHNPTDFPGKFVVRRHVIFHGQTEPQATTEHFVADSLDEIRRMVPQGLVRLARFDEDDAKIVEVWL
jgi:NAD-dependent SIR2 family protein deacetylase